MGYLNTILPVLLMVHALWIENAWGCYCPRQHRQTEFCSSHFVMAGAVHTGEPVRYGDTVLYFNHTMVVTDVFKKPLGHTLAAGDTVSVLAAYASSMCGIRLQTPHNYFLTAHPEEGMYSVNGCDWISHYESLTDAERVGISGGYDCSCYIQEVWGHIGPPDTTVSSDICARFPTPSSRDMCQRNDAGVCTWVAYN